MNDHDAAGGGDEPQDPNAESAGYAVGYGKPPVKHQFQKKTSGNPAGRPPRKRQRDVSSGLGNFGALSEAHQLWLDDARDPLKISINGKVREVTAQQAVILSTRQKALAGDARAVQLYLKSVKEAQAAAQAASFEGFKAAIEYKMKAEREIAHRRFLGRSIADILPHPDDVLINPRTGFHAIVGPVDEHERQNYVAQVEALENIQVCITENAEGYRKARGARKVLMLEQWHSWQTLYDRINDFLPPSLKRDLLDRSTQPGASKPGDFFSSTPEAVEAFKTKLQKSKRSRL